jgi:hypothetical protein
LKIRKPVEASKHTAETYTIRKITPNERDRVIGRYARLIKYERKASIHGACIKLYTDKREFKEMWEDNFKFMGDGIRPHGRLFALGTNGNLRVLYEPLSGTAIVLNCDYYGWIKSIALGVTGDLFENYYSTYRRFSVHGAVVDFGGTGLTIIGPPRTGKTTHSYGLLLQGHEFLRLEKKAKLVADDWYFVRIFEDDLLAYSSEKNCYVRGDIGGIWKEFKPLLEEASFDYAGRAVADIRRVVGERTREQTVLKAAILLKRDEKDREIVRKLSAEDALEYLTANDFCNPHQMVRTRRKKRLRIGFFEKFLKRLDIYLVNTVLDPLETQNEIRKLVAGI